jgi:ElaB/YqjD/DUF883 family membrane-anchored ribosome-binding protein
VTAPPEDAETDEGRALFQELLWVHGLIRRDLAVVERLADDVRSGATAADVNSGLRELQTTGPLWQLRVNCLQYCRFVHLHHRLEDRALFPALREVDPGIDRVVDRLEADHREVSDLLDRVEQAAGELADDAGAAVRDRVAERLSALRDHLLSHLDFEERQAGPAVRRLQLS